MVIHNPYILKFYNMKTNLLYALAVLFLITGCSKDDPKPRHNPEPEKIYLLRQKESSIKLSDGSTMTITWDYLHNQNNKLTGIDAVSKRGSEVKSVRTDLTYDERGRLQQITNEEGTVWTHQYDALNLPIRLEKKLKDGTQYVYINSFNTLGRLTEQKTYAGDVSDENYVGKMTVSYGKAGHVFLRRVLPSGEVSEEASVLTDDRNRPLPVLPYQVSLGFHSSEVTNESLFTEHNVVSVEEVKKTQTDAGNGSFTTTSLSYNDAGYPVNYTRTFQSGAVENTSYTYIIRD